MEGDPAPNVHKELLVLYRSHNNIYPFDTKEYYRAEFKQDENILVAKETDESRIAYEIKNENIGVSAIEFLFPGKWKLKYNGSLNREEEVEIRDKNKYFAKGAGETSFTHRFNLENISIDINNNRIGFRKI